MCVYANLDVFCGDQRWSSSRIVADCYRCIYTLRIMPGFLEVHLLFLLLPFLRDLRSTPSPHRDVLLAGEVSRLFRRNVSFSHVRCCYINALDARKKRMHAPRVKNFRKFRLSCTYLPREQVIFVIRNRNFSQKSFLQSISCLISILSFI